LFIITLALFSLSFAVAQQPAYFIMGENYLKGLKIFDILQDDDHNYYFATNEGIIKYDFIKYTKIEVKSAKSVSFFNLCINRDGVIYFNNLNNQIFELKKDRCRLFYELKGEQSSNLICLTNDDKGNLLIGCKGLIALDSAAKVIGTAKTQTPMSYFYRAGPDAWIFSGSRDTVLLWKQGEITEKAISYDHSKRKLGFFFLFDYLDTNYALDISSKYLYVFNKSNWQLTERGQSRLFQSSTNTRIYITGQQIWSPSSVSGINFSATGINSHLNTYYPDVFISDVFRDHEGNLLLGTFDKGVMVIPDLKVDDVVNSVTKDPMISLYADANKSVYMGSNKGLVYEYKNNNLNPITGNKNKSIEGIFGSNNSDFIIFDDRKVSCLNKRTKEVLTLFNASLKDVAFVSANEMYVGTNMGISKVTFTSGREFRVEPIPQQNVRVYSLAYNSKSGLLYSSGANGLTTIDRFGKTSKILYQGRGIFAEKIVCHQGLIYATDRETGILVLDNNNKISVIKPRFPNEDEIIKKLVLYENTFIISTSNGLYRVNAKGDIIKQYHTAFGFSSKKVYDFSVEGHFMWVSHFGGVQKIDINYENTTATKPRIVLREVRVNDLPIDFKQLHRFSSKERKFEFVIYSPTLRNQENIKYHYKLLGYNENWLVQGAQFNTITYNALSPGKYTLVVKAELSGKFSSEAQFVFTIMSPFYMQWWFILGSILLFLTTVYLIYRRQLNRQRQKSKQINELNLSKLTAIQSQMNPHFIFNSLNSIQDLVLQQNATKAYDSINKFAALIRKIMHHSSSEFIDIEEELSILNIYLELELLRFKKDFSYQINSNNITDIEIPPMLIQPYVENALKHGLLHKAGEKNLQIDMILQNGVFTCIITDNGIGRKKSQEMKDRQNKLYDSFSGSSLNTRLSILKKHFGGEIGVEIIDLYDEANNAIGTRVELRAPFKQKY
jgi:hypothetical protein